MVGVRKANWNPHSRADDGMSSRVQFFAVPESTRPPRAPAFSGREQAAGSALVTETMVRTRRRLGEYRYAENSRGIRAVRRSEVSRNYCAPTMRPAPMLRLKRQLAPMMIEVLGAVVVHVVDAHRMPKVRIPRGWKVHRQRESRLGLNRELAL